MAKARFRQADLQRTLRAARAEGVAVERIEIEPATGKITIITRNVEGVASSAPLDNWLAKHARPT